jgi:hypothetical protein
MKQKRSKNLKSAVIKLTDLADYQKDAIVSRTIVNEKQGL